MQVGSPTTANQSPEYDPRSDAYRLPFDPSAQDSVGTAVATGVAALEGVDESTLPTVYDVVDPEAVEALLASASGSPAASDVAVEFTYGGYRVVARPDEIHFRPADADRSASSGAV